MHNIRDYGAIGDGRTLDTRAVQKAFDTCASQGGGTVTFPPGRYLCGTLQLRSGLHVLLEAGATLLGSSDLDRDFLPDESRDDELYQDTSHSYFQHSLLWGEHLSDVSITGTGGVDLQSVWEKDFSRSEYRRGAKGLALRECRNVLVQGITVRNATDLALYFAGCETVRVTSVVVDTHIDGISPDGCRDVVISGCIVRSGDDGIVPKSSYTLGRPAWMENLVVSGCVISSRCNAIKLGTESNAGYRNVVITGCTIYDTRYAGIALEVVDGGVLDGVVITGITMRNVGTPFFFIVGDRRRGPEGTGVGSMENIVVDNVVATGPYEAWAAIHNSQVEPNGPIQHPEVIASTVTGLPGHPIRNLSFSNVRLVVTGGGTHDDAHREVPELPGTYPESNKFGRPPASGLWFRHVADLVVRNVRVTTLTPDARPPLGFVDVAGLDLDVTPRGVEA